MMAAKDKKGDERMCLDNMQVCASLPLQWRHEPLYYNVIYYDVSNLHMLPLAPVTNSYRDITNPFTKTLPMPSLTLLL